MVVWAVRRHAIRLSIHSATLAVRTEATLAVS